MPAIHFLFCKLNVNCVMYTAYGSSKLSTTWNIKQYNETIEMSYRIIEYKHKKRRYFAKYVQFDYVISILTILQESEEEEDCGR